MRRTSRTMSPTRSTIEGPTQRLITLSNRAVTVQGYSVPVSRHLPQVRMQVLSYEGGVTSSGRSHARGQEEDEDFEGFEGIDAEQLRQMMSDPRYAALFAEHCKFSESVDHIDGNMQYLQTEDRYDEDEDGYIDLSQLPPEQQQYFLQQHLLRGGDDEEEEEDDEQPRGIVGRGDGVGFFAEGDEDEGMEVQFNENAQRLQQRFEYDDEGRMLPEAESDYCEDLAEIYIVNGSQDDVDRYKSIHLMDKGPGYDNQEGEKFQCEETGAHFEFLEMVRRLKRLQRCRTDIDKLIEE